MNFNWKNLSKKELENNYNPRKAVADFSKYILEYKSLGQKTREEIPSIIDVSYGGTPLQKLDIFGKKNLNNANVHIFIHGGYWRALDKSDHSQLAIPFVNNDLLYFSINHELCPHVTLSEIVQQIISAIIWVYKNCKRYGGNPNKITISGHSAGAHLCSMAINTPYILTCVGSNETTGWIDQTKIYTKKIINNYDNVDFSILENENHFSLMISLADSKNKFVKKMIYMAKNI